MASCGQPRLLSGLEAALSAALRAKAGPTRQAALEEAARLIAEGEGGSTALAAYLRNRAAAQSLIAAGSVGAARARLATFDFRALATKVAAEAEQEGCEKSEAVTATPGAGSGLAAATDGFDATTSGFSRGTLKPIVATKAANNSSVLYELDRIDQALLALLAFLVVVPALALAAHRLRRRREGRFLCYLPATLSGRYRDEKVFVVDFSRNGARLALKSHMLEVGERIEFELVGLRRVARIRWARRRSVGLRLNEPLNDAEFDKVMETARRGAGTAHA